MAIRVLVTGASGFVGRVLINTLIENQKCLVRAAVRGSCAKKHDSSLDVVTIDDLDEYTDWEEALAGCDVVIHMAARVHVMKEQANDALNQYRLVNVAGTLNLAEQAARLGVKRFIFLSSIKVNGEKSLPNTPFKPDAQLKPEGPYAISKYEAEQGLIALAERTGMDTVIIRPPLVYGPYVKGNFQRMMNWLKKGYPLPLGAVNNKRSFVSVFNLVDLIFTCIDHPKAANQVFLISDGEDVSTTELLKKISTVLGVPLRTLPIPMWLLNSVAILIGRKKMLQSLCGNLQVDMSKTQALLGWNPLVEMQDALLEIAHSPQKNSHSVVSTKSLQMVDGS